MSRVIDTTAEGLEIASAETAENKNEPAAVNVGVIGYGYWGPNLVRNLHEIPAARLTMVADRDISKLAHVRQAYPGVRVSDDYRRLLESDVEAVVVATPVSTHYAIARDCLANGKHVLVEKPLARSSQEGQALVDLARERKRVLMVGHTFEYNPAVEMLRDIVASGEIGRVYYAYSARTNLGLFQKDINVMWDLAPHDLSILMFVLGLNPSSVSAIGEAYVQPKVHDVARLALYFPNQIQAHVHVSWLDPSKVRRLTIVGDKKMAVYDDVETLEKIKIYDKGVNIPSRIENYGEFQLSYRYGDILIPRVPLNEPLKVECSHFVDSVMTGRRPRSCGEVGLKVVKILEAADKSLHNGGQSEPIDWTNEAEDRSGEAPGTYAERRVA
jgi:predicted dehydrogenase